MEENKKTYSRYTYKIFKDISDIPKIYNDWKHLLSFVSYTHPSIDPDYYILESKILSSKAKPYIICIYDCGRICSMLIGRNEISRLPINLGYMKIPTPQYRQIHIYKHGFLGVCNNDICRIIYFILKKNLNSGEAELAVFTHLRLDNPFHEFIRSQFSFSNIVLFGKKDKYWIMDLPGSLDALYKRHSKRHRLTLKKKTENLEKSFLVAINKYTQETEILKGLIDAALISSKTYQYKCGAGLKYDEVTRERFRTLSKNNLINLYVLYINDEPAAYQWGIKYQKSFILQHLGHDPKWNKYSIGIVLLMKVLKDIIENEKLSLLDFGVGDHEYKKRFGTNCFDIMSLYIFPGKPIHVAISLIFFIFSAISDFFSRATKFTKLNHVFMKILRG